jgi:hypothetical protein
VVEVVLALFAAVLTGGRRFAHVERLRSDEVATPFRWTVLGLRLDFLFAESFRS